jgi:hypothetical protein
VNNRVRMLGAVASLLTLLLMQDIPHVHAVVYGCPSCVDQATASTLHNRYTDWKIVPNCYCL